MWRPVAKQTWPWNWKLEYAPALAAAAGRSASSSTINGLLPPSSRLTFLSSRPASAPTIRPTSVDPVKLTMSTFGSVISAWPVSASPMTIWSRPSGRPASLKIGREDGAAADRRLRIRLEHDGIAERQGRRDDAHAQHARRVPRRDRADDADRARGGPSTAAPAARSGTSEPYGCHGMAAAASASPAVKFCSWCILLRWAPVSRCVHVPNSGRCAS